MWQQWINGILGLWLIIVPYLGFNVFETFSWTIMGTGIAIAILGFWGALVHNRKHTDRKDNHHAHAR